MVTVNEILTKMGSAQYISLFDAKSGYWQIPVAEEDQWKTAFVTHDGLYEWTRMPFWLRNAAATFVRAMKTILRPVRAFADTYVDDMSVGSAQWPQHMSCETVFAGDQRCWYHSEPGEVTSVSLR